MINGMRFKVCGLTREEDAGLAAELGADALGFILYEKSPRWVSGERWRGLVKGLPKGPWRVAVMVEPTEAALGEAKAAGFDRFQIHFVPDGAGAGEGRVAKWAGVVGAENLWLGPKLPPAVDVSDSLIQGAGAVLLDTYHEGYGGSGRVNDWGRFARHQARRPELTWILAGGLGPDNAGAARAESGATFMDFNSGVERSPGVKDEGKLRRLVEVLRVAGRAGTG